MDDKYSPNYSTGDTAMELWGFDGGDYQKWKFVHVGDGYYKIISVKSGMALSVLPNYENKYEKYLVQQNYTGSDRQKWKLTKSSSGAYIIRPKSGEAYSIDWCMSSGTQSTDTTVEQKDYTNNSDFRDEWVLTKIQYSATVYNYYDLGYPVRYNESSSVSVNKINSYMDAVSKQYLRLFGLDINSPTATYYQSYIDICKGDVDSSNINTICSHGGTIHTERDNVIWAFNNSHMGNSQTTNILWSGHKITSTATNGDIDENRSCSNGTGIFMLEISNILKRTINSQGVLMHELNHQYGARDHYHELAIKGDRDSCIFKDICSKCGNNPRPLSCIMNESRINISNDDVICSECQNEILAHLNEHHKN